MGYRSIRRCDPREIQELWKYRERLTRKLKEEDKILYAQVKKFPNKTKAEHEGARDYVVYGGKAPDRDGMDSINKLLQKLNRKLIKLDLNYHYAVIKKKIQDVHGNIKLIHYLRIVADREATEAAQQFEDAYAPKIKHLRKIGRNPRARKQQKKKLEEIEREAGI